MLAPRFIYGTAWKKERTVECVDRALAAGFRAIDTACQPKHYQEHLVGEGIKAGYSKYGIAREQVFIQTKFTPISGQDPNRVPYDPADPLETQVAASVAVSLRNLHTDHLDSLLLHSPLRSYEDTLRVWRSFEGLHASGTLRQIGISNCYDLTALKRLCSDARVPPAIVQNRFYSDSGYDVQLRDFCRQQGIAYQSFWTLTANPHLLRSAPCRAAASKRGASTEQVLFRFVMDLGITPLTGSSSAEHLAADLGVLAWEPLEDTEFAQLCQLVGEDSGKFER